MSRTITGYSTTQVALHWAVAVLVAFQFVASDGIERAWRAFENGEAMAADNAPLTYLHIAAGILILLLIAARIALRLTRGAPPPPADEPRLLQIAGEAVHHAIYVLLVLLPVSGSIAWFAGVQQAGAAHVLFQNLLLVAIGLHIGGALFQHFIRRSNVMMRMLQSQRD